MSSRADPIVRVYPKFRKDWRTIFCLRGSGECLDGVHGDLLYADPDQPVSINDLIVVRNRETGVLSGKYLMRYNREPILVSKHPPVRLWSGLEIIGPVVLRVSPGAPAGFRSDEVELFRREMNEARAGGYGSPQWFMSQLGRYPPKSCSVRL